MLIIVILLSSGCLTRPGGPSLPYVKPAQSVEPVDPMQVRMAARMEALEEEIQRLRDLVERAQAPAANQESLADLRRRVEFIERQLGIEAMPAGTPKPPVDAAAPAPATRGPGDFEEAPRPQMEVPAVSGSVPINIQNKPIPPDEAAFRQAYTLVRRGSLDQAVPLLEEFVKTYPKSRFAANALYWIGEALLARGRYDEAVLQFDRVIKEFPGSKKELSALLKQGQAFAKMGDSQSARILFQKLIRDYPHTAQARIAQSALKSLPRDQ